MTTNSQKCQQISFQLQYSGSLVPVYRHTVNGHWIPCAQNPVDAPEDDPFGTPGYSKWKVLLRAGYEVVGT